MTPRVALLFVALACSACAAPLMKLPSGPSTPASDGLEIISEATAACQRVTSLTAEIAVSGSVGGQRVRGHLLVGVSRPASVRLEAAAPFGAPLFIFVARGDAATLLLPRDERVLEHGKPDEVLGAVAGVPLDPIDLRAVLTGCALAPDPVGGRAPAADWRMVPDGTGQAYMHRENNHWRLVAVVRTPTNREAWRAEYRGFVDGLPRDVRLASVADTKSPFDLRLTLSQVETNIALDADAFSVQVPRGTRAISLEELRETGPMASRAASRR